jgi:hypothetical protein
VFAAFWMFVDKIPGSISSIVEKSTSLINLRDLCVDRRVQPERPSQIRGEEIEPDPSRWLHRRVRRGAVLAEAPLKQLRIGLVLRAGDLDRTRTPE